MYYCMYLCVYCNVLYIHTYIWLSHCIGTTLIDESPHSKLNFNWKVSSHISFFKMNNVNDIKFLALVASRIPKINNVLFMNSSKYSNITANKHTNDCTIRMYWI